MTDFDLPALLLWLGDAFLIITVVAVCCCYCRRRRDREDDDDRGQEAAAAAAAASHAQPAPAAAAVVQMAAMAVALLDHVTYPRQNVGDDGGGRDDHPPAAAEECCAICLGRFEDGDWCSVMPFCCHEFHRSCIAKWLTACNNTCPLCRAQLQWDVVAHDMV